MDIILTSAGFDNKKILHKFVQIVNANMVNSKILFVPTAAITDGGRKMLPFCREEILESGILENNIQEVEIREIQHLENINEYCAIYVAGGDAHHLVNEMRIYNFKKILDDYLKSGGIYFGVSAGSIALTNTFKNCLNYINCKLNVHKNLGNRTGKIDKKKYCEIDLTDNQALLIHNDEAEIID